jgi:hypothetical protein
MEFWRTIRDMAVRAYRLFIPHHTGEVQSWATFIRELEARGALEPNKKLIRWQKAIPQRRIAADREAAARRAELAERTRAKWGAS